MPLFKRAGEKYTLEIAITGVKLGDRLLQVGCVDAPLVAALGGKVGISGRACIVVSDANEAERATRAAERAGVLLEVERSPLSSFPFADHEFDVAVVHNQDGLIASITPEQRVAVLQQVRRTLNPRGRIVIIERAPRAGLGALLDRNAVRPNPHYLSTGGALTGLPGEGGKAVRDLAERDGLS